MSRLICEIVAPATRLYYDFVYMVVAPGSEGEMGFLEDHVPLLTMLASGTVRIEKEKDGEKEQFLVLGGALEVTGKKVIILADHAINLKDVDVEAAREDLVKFEQELASMSADDNQRINVEENIEWCKLQIEAATK